MKNPYKELSPYLESDAFRFKGRTVEIEEMYESFDRNEYLVCHADSGEGKSSIIEAGLIPKMKENNYFPIRIVFNSDEHFKNNNVDFEEVICGIIEKEIEKLGENKSFAVSVVYPHRLTNSDELEPFEWEKELIRNNAWLKLRYTRLTIDNLLYTPVLIFDQFEEVFTNPQSQEWTDKFFAWMQELSTDLCPQRIVKEIEKHVSENDFPEIYTKKYFKAIFSLRSEYVGKLDYWGLQRHYIPMLKNNRYLLRPLTIKGAKEVITQQEGYDGLNAIADEIVEMLRKLQRGKNYVTDNASELPCIPALLLSIVCSRAFNMTPEERSNFIQNLATENDEEKELAIYALIADFYEKAVSECGILSGDMSIIEDVLVNSEGNRQRVSSHADALKSIDFSNKYLKILEEHRLIRVIPEYNREEDSIELIHDALCPVILKKKEQRKKEIENEVKRETERANRLKVQREELTSSLFLLALLAFIIWFLKSSFQNNETVLNIYNNDAIISLTSLSILPILIYASVKRLKITSWLSVYGVISNVFLVSIFLFGRTREIDQRCWGLVAFSMSISAITLIYSFKFKPFENIPKREYRTIIKSIPLLLFYLVIAGYVFYFCVFNKTIGLPEPFNSSWAIVVIPLLTHELIRNAFGQRQNIIAFIVLCCLLGLLTYNTSVVPFALPSYVLICVLGAILGVIIWSYWGLTWGKKTMAIATNILVLALVVLLNMGFNVSKVKYDSVSHVFNWIDVLVHDDDNCVGVVSACSGDTILPCAFDSIDYRRQHYCFLTSNKISYDKDVIDNKGLYTYSKSTNTAMWKCLFIDEVETNISKYKSSTPDTMREDSIRIYAARVYHEVRNANINYFTSGEMYSLCNVKSLDKLMELQNRELTDILNEFSNSSFSSFSKPLNISQLVAFNKAFARSFYLCMLKDRILQKDSVNLFNLTQEIITLYFYDAGKYELTTNSISNFNMGSFHKTHASTIKASDLRKDADLGRSLDGWYNHVRMLLSMDMGSNAEDYVNTKVGRYNELIGNIQSINDRMKQESKRNLQRMSKLLQKGDKLELDDLQEAVNIYKKQLDLTNEIKDQTNTQIDQIDMEKSQMDLDFQKLINDVFSALSNMVLYSPNIYNSEFVEICEQLYVISVLRQYEIAPIYLGYLEQMDNAKSHVYREFRKMQEQEDSLKQMVKSFRF